MRKLFSITFIFVLMFCFSGCLNSPSSNDKPKETSKIDTFEVEIQSIIQLFEETGKYVETNVYEFDNNEKNTCGTIRLDPEYYDDSFADECIYTQVRTYENKVFDIYLTYDVSGDEKYYEKLPELSSKILSTIKPNAGDVFSRNFDINQNDFHSKDFENLRYSISYKEWGATETRVQICIVHIKDDVMQ